MYSTGAMRLFIGIVIVGLFVFAWILAQGIGETLGGGIVERLVP